MTAPFPAIAVLLAAYNGRQYLSEQIDSILKQQHVSVKLFVSVDKSEDGTETWVQELASENSKIELLPTGRHYGGAARNFFRLLRDVDFSTFDYVAFADQDDIWLPKKLSRATEMLSATGASGYSSDFIAFWPNGRRREIKKSQPQVEWDFLFESPGPGCTFLIRSSLATAIKNRLAEVWDDAQGIGFHDWFVYAFARARGYAWIIDTYPGILYRQHENNQIGVNSGLRAWWHRAKKILNGWGREQSLLIARIIGLASNEFVQKTLAGGRLGMLRLAFCAPQCRRRKDQQALFFLACFILFLRGVGQRD